MYYVECTVLHYICTARSPGSLESSDRILSSILFVSPGGWALMAGTEKIQIRDCKLTNCPVPLYLFITLFFTVRNTRAKKCLEFPITSSPGGHHSRDREYWTIKQPAIKSVRQDWSVVEVVEVVEVVTRPCLYLTLSYDPPPVSDVWCDNQCKHATK